MRVDDHSYFSAVYSIICNTQGLVRALLWFLPFCFSQQVQEGVLNLAGIQTEQTVFHTEQTEMNILILLVSGPPGPYLASCPQGASGIQNRSSWLQKLHHLPAPTAEPITQSWAGSARGLLKTDDVRRVFLWSLPGSALKPLGPPGCPFCWQFLFWYAVARGGWRAWVGARGNGNSAVKSRSLWLFGFQAGSTWKRENLYIFFLAVLGRRCSSLQCSGFSLRWLLLSRLVGSRAQTQ